MILSEMQAEVLKMLGNIPSAHPLYALIYPAAGSERTNIIYRAANRLIRMAVGLNRADANLFPELKTSWTLGPTIVGQNQLLRPSDCIGVQDVASADQPTLPDWPSTRERPVTYFDRVGFGNLSKVQSQYPRLYTLKGKWVIYYPTTDATHIDYLRVYGIKAEDPVSNPGDTFTIDQDWHPVVVTLAASMMATKFGWSTRAKDWMADAMMEIGNSSSPTSMQDVGGFVKAQGAPTRVRVYGR